MDAKSLYKSLSRNKPSEKLWLLEEQPENTCPMIDDTISGIQSFLAKMSSLSSLLTESQNNLQEDQAQFNNQCQSLIDDIENLEYDYKKLNNELEKLRSYLTNIRQTANNYKDTLWSKIDASLDIDTENNLYSLTRFSSASYPRISFQEGEDVSDLVSEIVQNHHLLWNELELMDSNLILKQEQIMEALEEVKETFLSEKPLDEVINCVHLNNWVESVIRVSAQSAGSDFVAFLESHGYSKK